MASNTLQLLLRLPPSLRSHALLNLNKSALLRRASSNTKTPPPPPPSKKPTPKSSTPPPAPRQPPKSSPTPSSKPPPPAPPTTTTPPPTTSNELSRLSRVPPTGGPSLRSIIETQGSVLLYNSPNHTSFFLTSYLLAGLLVTGAVLQATSLRDSFFSADRKRTLPWWTGALSGTACLTTVLIATAIGLAPTRLVRTVRLVGQSGGNGGGVLLRVGLKHPFPLLATKKARDAVIEAPLSEVFLDRRIPIAGPNLTFSSIPRTEAGTWTASAKTPAKGSGIAQNVRRMFLREGMAYMRIEGHGRWKLDLQGSEMLDGGRCLEEAMAPDMQPVKGLVGFLRGLMG